MEITEERDDEEDDNLSTLKDKYPIKTRLSDEPSLGSQPSFKGLESREEIGGNTEMTSQSLVSMEDMTEKIDIASAVDFETFKA